MYRGASDTRARLAEAARARSGLDAAQRALQKNQRLEDADALDKVRAEMEYILHCMALYVTQPETLQDRPVGHASVHVGVDGCLRGWS